MAGYVITGRIFEIVHTSELSAQIVLKKKDGDKFVLVAIDIFGYWKDKAFKELKLKPKDKIRGNVHVKSKFYAAKNKYYTDNTFKEIYLLEPAPVEMNNLFKEEETGNLIDRESGEIRYQNKNNNG